MRQGRDVMLATRLVVVLLAGTLAGACDNLIGVDGPSSPGPVYEWVLENGPFVPLNAISGAAPDAVVAVGGAGVVLRWDGTEWSRDPAVPGRSSRAAVWSAGPDEFFVADQTHNAEDRAIHRCDASGCTTYDSESLPGSLRQIRDLWGVSSTDVFAVGTGGTVIRWDGESWTGMAGDVPDDLSAVWGSGPNNVFAGGNDGIVHYDGTAWNAMPIPPAAGGRFRDLWGSGPADVYAVGVHDVLHFDGAAWEIVDVASSNAALTGIWGTSSSDVFITGSSGIVLHLDASGWRSLAVPEGVGWLAGVWGSDSDDVWAVGEQGNIIHFDGEAWARVRGGIGRDLDGVAGRSDTDIYAVGSRTLLHNDGAGWARLMTEAESQTTHTDVAFIGSYAYVTGSGGIFSLLRVSSGGTIQNVRDAPLGSWYAVWGTAPDTIVTAGWSGTVAHFDGTAWTGVDTPSSTITDLWGASGTDVYAVGWDHLLHYDGLEWNQIVVSQMRYYLLGVWGTASDDVYTVGMGGLILHWDGDTWQETESGTYSELRAIRGSSNRSIYAVGANGTIVHYDGTTWGSVELPSELRDKLSDIDLNDVWLAEGSDVFIVGDYGTILRGRR